MSTDLKQDIMNAAYDGYQPTKTVPLPMPPNCGSGVQKPLPPAPSKEEVIIRLVESLNIGGEEADYQRVDIAFMQYEQIQKKLNAWKEF
jgi:hypothetical protein